MIGIVGASGFIGRSFSDFLGARGVPYTALLRDPGAAAADAFPNVADIRTFDVGDEFGPAAFEGIDTLLLCSWATKPNLRGNSHANEVQKNILPYCNLLSGLVATGVKHLIFLSSGGTVYGNVTGAEPITEDQPRHPCTPYGFGKTCVEAAIEAAWAGDGRRYTIIRPSNPVGRHQVQSLGAHGLFPTVLHQILTGQTIEVFGDGSTVRDYFSVQDLSDLILKVAQDTDTPSSIVNASSGQGMSIDAVIETCALVLGKPAKVVHMPEKAPEIAFNVLSNRRAQTLFDWSPAWSVEDIARDLAKGLSP